MEKAVELCLAVLGNRELGNRMMVFDHLAWWLTKSAVNLRHPFNPIGSSDSVAFKWVFVAILFVVLLMAIQLARWLRASVRKE